MKQNDREFIWVEKFRPFYVKDCVLPKKIKKIAEGIVKSGDLQNMLFYSGPGMGKTTLARAICNELDLDYIIINGSKEGRLIDTVRNTVTHFANTLSIDNSDDKPKVVIYDEFDNAGEVQMAVRGLVEEVSENCRFIFTGNYITKIIEPIHSRVGLIDFSIPEDEKIKLLSEIMKRCEYILNLEGIEYEKKYLARFIEKHFPDFRKILNELQLYSLTGKIDKGILDAFSTKTDMLIMYIMDKDFRACRKWIINNSYDGSIYSTIINKIYPLITDGDSKAAAIILSNDYQYKHNFAIDPDLNLSAYILELIDIIL